MPDAFDCPSCGERIQVHLAPGTPMNCPRCAAPVTVPVAASDASMPMAAPVSPYGAGMAQPVRTGLAIAAMVCGIAGVITCIFPLGIVGLVLGIVALVKTGREPQVYGGRGMAIAGVCTGAISTLIIVPLLLVSILLPSFARARELSKRAVCNANLKGIGMAMAMYANENMEAFPPDLDTLVAGGSISQGMLTCPSADAANYVYIRGLTTAAPPGTPLIYEPIENHHNDGANILFTDLHVEFIKPPKLDEILAPYRNAELPEAADELNPERRRDNGR
ncbi:MAG: DUF4190 domain-containing protein [Phycisphaerae bacterium]|nr:DUF4190 domain-containing protein [Phycisphaerae bacterium]